MENINKSFDIAMGIICARCSAKDYCEKTKTKCNEWEVLSAIRDELNHSNEVIEECDKLVEEIERKEQECKEKGICPYCGGKYEQSSVQVEE